MVRIEVVAFLLVLPEARGPMRCKGCHLEQERLKSKEGLKRAVEVL